MKVEKIISLLKDEVVVCVASGPSLTKKDCELVESSGNKIITTNSSFIMCPNADIFYGFDARWWIKNIDTVKQKNSNAILLSNSKSCQSIGVEPFSPSDEYHHFGNSGTAIISMAAYCQAKKIILVGYDCCFDGKRKHWHADHDESSGLTNCLSISRWPEQFKRVSKFCKLFGIEVVNCSRRTAIESFKFGVLEDEL